MRESEGVMTCEDIGVLLAFCVVVGIWCGMLDALFGVDPFEESEKKK
jgi:hypothetical protein